MPGKRQSNSFVLSAKPKDGTSVRITSTEVKYATSAAYVQPASIAESSWSATYPASLAEGTWLHSRTKVTYSDGTTTTTYASSRVGANGAAGYNTAPVFLYKRSASAVSSVGFTDTLTYTFATRQLSSAPNGWSQTIPANDGNPLYVTVATAFANTATDTIAYSEWATPVVLAENGANGINTAPVFLYRRAASAPAKPAVALTYTFATGLLSGGSLNGWSQTIPATNGYPCWVIQATASGTGATDTIAATEWSSQRKLVEDGANGEDGQGYECVFIRTKTDEAPVIVDDGSGSTYDNDSYYDSNGSQHGEDEFLPVAYVANGTIEANAVASGRGISGGTAGKYGECTDDPQGVSDEWPYEWQMKRTKDEPEADGSRAWKYYAGTMKPYQRKARDGVTPWFSPSVVWVDSDSDGWSLGAQTFHVDAGIMLNGTNIGFESPLAILSSPSSATVSFNENTGKIDVSIADDTDPADYEGEVRVSMSAMRDGQEYSVTGAIAIVAKRKGEAQESYFIRSTVGSVTVAANDTAATLNTSIDFWKKAAGEAEEAYACHYALYRRKGTAYTRRGYSTGKVAATSVSNTSTTVNGTLYDAFVVFISDTALSGSALSSAAPASYLAKLEIPVNKLGDTGGQGQPGPGGEVYSILSTLGGITIGSNTTSATFTATISFYKKVGGAARAAYSCYCSIFRRKGGTYTYIANNGSNKATNWYVEGLAVSSGTCDALVFCIYDTASTAHSGYLAEMEIPVYKHGDTGPNYFPCGIYDPTFTYTKTGQRTPVVFMEDESVWNEYAQAYGDYWYLTADTNVVNGVHYKPQDGSEYWAKAVNYGIVMVGAQFARFAKNGAGIMAGDYYYSANGRIDGVERVDGEGADGNAVTASNPPAYTRFMGDPLIQNGYLNRRGITGPVSSDRAQLQTVSLPRGVTLTVTVRGKTGASGTYGYFGIYKGTSRMGSYTFIMYTSRVASISYTTTEAGEYTIEYYGNTAATAGTFYLSYEVSGHFYPNWWVDLKTGKMCGAKDNFILDGSGNVKVNGAMMTHKVKLQTKCSSWVTYPQHAAYEDDYWDGNGDVYLYEPESDGLPVRIYADPDAVYYGLRSCRLKYDQVYVGLVGGTGKRVVIYLPPPHLFIGQRIAITNQAISFPAGSATAGVFLQMDYMLYTRTDFSEGICLTGQDAYFEDDGTGEHDGDGKNGKPYICNVPERGGAGPIPACGIWIGENVQAINGIFFMSDLVDGLNIEDYEWMELTAVRGYFAEKYEGTGNWESTMKYNAYWMLTRWEKKET